MAHRCIRIRNCWIETFFIFRTFLLFLRVSNYRILTMIIVEWSPAFIHPRAHFENGWLSNQNSRILWSSFFIPSVHVFILIFSGRILTGVVRKQKMQRTIIIRRDYLHFVKKYGRFEKRHNVSSSLFSTLLMTSTDCYEQRSLGTFPTSLPNWKIISENPRECLKLVGNGQFISFRPLPGIPVDCQTLFSNWEGPSGTFPWIFGYENVQQNVHSNKNVF